MNLQDAVVLLALAGGALRGRSSCVRIRRERLLRRHFAASGRPRQRGRLRRPSPCQPGVDLEPVCVPRRRRYREPNACLRRVPLGQRLAVEAAVATVDRYSLQPAPAGARRGVGLSLVPEADSAGKAWNVDVYTTWEFKSRMSLYGRLGYAQSEAQPTYLPGFNGDVVRRKRDGVNYGVGLRYDMTSALRPAPRVRALRPLAGRARQRRPARERPGAVRHAVPLLII